MWIYIVFGVIAVGVVYLCIDFPSILRGAYGPEPAVKAGEFGDQYGALNTLFSGLAFAGVILAILLQREDLKISREELSKSTEAQVQAGKALRDQIKSMNRSAEVDLLTTLICEVRQDLDKLAERRKAAKQPGPTRKLADRHDLLLGGYRSMVSRLYKLDLECDERIKTWLDARDE